MFATFFVTMFVSIPLSMTLIRMFQRSEAAPRRPEDDLPRYTMRDFRHRDEF